MSKRRPLPLDVEPEEDKGAKNKIAWAIRYREAAIAKEEAAMRKLGICPICRCYRTTEGVCSLNEDHDKGGK